MLTATQSFFEPLEDWAKAMREGDFAAARHHAEHLVKSGELLVVHPDFRRCFAEHGQTGDPRDLLVHLCEFLLCAAEGREKAFKQYIKDNKSGRS